MSRPRKIAETFTLEIPFSFSGNFSINPKEDWKPIFLDSIKIRLIKRSGSYVLKFSNLESKKAAKDFISKAFTTLFWLGLRYKCGLEFKKEFGKVVYHKKPIKIDETSFYFFKKENQGWEEIHGGYDGNDSVIYPEGKNLIITTVGKPEISQVGHYEDFSQTIKEGLLVSKKNHPLNEKLFLACEYFLSTGYEPNYETRFINQITTLEILAEKRRASKPVQNLLKSFKGEIEKFREKAENSSSINDQLNSLSGSLGRLEEISIKKRIQELVAKNLGDHPNLEDPETVAQQVSKFYDYRSSLLHNGKIKHGYKSGEDRVLVIQATNILGFAIPQILKNLLKSEI